MSGKITAIFFGAALLFIAAALSSCGYAETEFRMRGLEHMPKNEANPLAPIFAQNSHLRIVHVEIGSNASDLELLATGELDLGLVENSSPFQNNIRVVLPIYKSVLHLQVREGLDLSGTEQPLRDKSIYIIEGSAAGKAFLKMATSRQGLKSGDYEVTTSLRPGETDVVIYFGPINPRDKSWYLPGYRLYPLDDGDVEHALSSEAISYLLPRMELKVIPAHTYDLPGNEKEIYSLEVDALLATRKDISENAIYELTKILVERKPWFASIAPEVFSDVREDFDPMKLNFPLHSGALRYLDRDEPSTLERYAETINMLVYLVFLLLTGAVGFARWHARNKKDRIDEFYSRIMSIRMRAMHEPHAPLLMELQQLELEAFDSLIKEKLAADESFRIFIELLTRAMGELDPYGVKAES